VVTVARKPCGGPVATSCLARGTGALNVGACRVGAEERSYKGSGRNLLKLVNHGPGDTGIGTWDGHGSDQVFEVNGRWPSNLVLSSKTADLLDKVPTSRTGARVDQDWPPVPQGLLGWARGAGAPEYLDTGGASRFFRVVDEG
jgi:hypothetical protein